MTGPKRISSSSIVRQRVLLPLALIVILVVLHLRTSFPSAQQQTSTVSEDRSETAVVAASYPAESRIPKTFHFIYVSPGIPKDSQPPIPPDILDRIDGWRQLHPGYEIILWNNTLVREQLPSSMVNFIANRITTMAWVADLLRYQILLRYGGVYLDTDLVAIRNMEPLLSLPGSATIEAFGVCENPFVEVAKSAESVSSEAVSPIDLIWDESINGTCKTICNCVIGAIPNASVIASATRKSMRRTRAALRNNKNAKYSLRHSGPAMWTGVVHEHINTTAILQSFVFLPCHYYSKDDCVRETFSSDPRVIGMHQWDGSWLPPK